jgi:hypothetical protein
MVHVIRIYIYIICKKTRTIIVHRSELIIFRVISKYVTVFSYHENNEIVTQTSFLGTVGS